MPDKIQDIIREKYTAVASSSLSSDNPAVRAIAQAFGYSPAELSSIPAGANMGLSCGNPIAIASLKPGETVVDLGSGGGLDVFLAAQKVGPAGRSIGIDMTAGMIARAQKNAANANLDNVHFYQAPIDQLPLPDRSVDCIISNCVINLAPDKNAVFREMFRVLKPGGRVTVSDIALKQKLPLELANDIMAYVGCIAGAIPIDDFDRGLRSAGFSAVHIQDSAADLNVYAQLDGQSACCSPPMTAQTSKTNLPIAPEPCCACNTAPAAIHDGLTAITHKYNLNDYAASVKIRAVKPPA